MKDYIFSSLALLFLFSISVFFAYLLAEIFNSFFYIKNLLLSIFFFIMVYGAASIFYVGLLNRIYPLVEGTFEMDHVQFTLWKHHAIIGEFGRSALQLFFFPVFLWPLLYSLLGAKIGKFVAIGGTVTDPLLTEIGDYAILGQDSVLASHTMVSNQFFLQKIMVGKRATVGINAVIMPGVQIGENSVVAPGAVVTMGTKIPSNEYWGGVPARFIKKIEPV